VTELAAKYGVSRRTIERSLNREPNARRAA
jgi:hypothetical protein